MDSVDEFLDAFGEEKGTTRVYRAGLDAFLKFYKSTGGNTLDAFLEAVEEDLRRPRREKKHMGRNTLKDFIRYLEQEGYAPKTIRSYVSAVQSFAKYYDLTISTRYVDMPTSRPISDKYPWSLEKVAAFIGKIDDPEIQSIGVTIFQSGLSISDILALTWDDVRLEFEAEITPLCFDLARIKTDVPFLTFIGRWGVSLLKDHLALKTKGNKLRLEDPLYTVSCRVIDLQFEDLAKRMIGEYKGRNPMRPHSLRAAFRTLLGDAGLDRDVVKFFMGQRLPEQDKVYHSRSRDGWRKLYEKYEYAISPPTELV